MYRPFRPVCRSGIGVEREALPGERKPRAARSYFLPLSDFGGGFLAAGVAGLGANVDFSAGVAGSAAAGFSAASGAGVGVADAGAGVAGEGSADALSAAVALP